MKDKESLSMTKAFEEEEKSRDSFVSNPDEFPVFEEIKEK